MKNQKKLKKTLYFCVDNFVLIILVLHSYSQL